MNTDTAHKFRSIQSRTYCPFARDAIIWGATSWRREADWRFNVERIAQELTTFLASARRCRLDGFVVELDGDTYGQSIAALSSGLNRFLCTLSDFDPASAKSMAAKIDNPNWEFRFAAERIFVITFAPCYPSTSSRYGFGRPEVFFFLQPQSSFEQNKIPRGEELGRLRNQIRHAFAAAGMSYDVDSLKDIMNAPVEAARFIKPLLPTDPPVRWWET